MASFFLLYGRSERGGCTTELAVEAWFAPGALLMCAYATECSRALVVEPPRALLGVFFSSAKIFPKRIRKSQTLVDRDGLCRLGSGLGFTYFVEATAQAACVPPSGCYGTVDDRVSPLPHAAALPPP